MLYQVTQGQRDDEAYKGMMNTLMARVFGFTFEKWYALNKWDERYECYSIIDSGRILSNVSLTKMTLLVGGKPIKAIQLGAIATLPGYRGQGLSRRIMEYVLAKYQETPAFLFANRSVLDFYPKFGFKLVGEVQPYLKLEHPLRGGHCANLPLDSPTLSRLVEERSRFSNIVDVIDADSINWFHIVMEFEDDIYYLPHLDTAIIAVQEESTLYVYDVISTRNVRWEDIYRCLPFIGCDIVEFAFMPDALGCDYNTCPDGQGNGYLFSRGLEFSADTRFPYMATT